MPKRFLLKLMLFLLPILLAEAGIVSFAIYVGNAMPLQWVADLHVNSNVLIYDPPFINQYAYKIRMIENAKPAVLVLGSSRVLHFRAGFFDKDPAVFYGSGLNTLNLEGQNKVLAFLGDAEYLEVLMLGIDQPLFNASYQRWWPPNHINLDEIDILAHSQDLFRKLLIREYSIRQLIQRKNPVGEGWALGAESIKGGMGYRSDGSQQSINLVRGRSSQHLINQGRADLENGVKMFQPGDSLSPEALQQLEDILQYAQEREIFVIGFTQPYAPSLYTSMMQTGQYSYISELVTELQALFERYGFAYFDFTDVSALDVTDENMIDAWHYSERVALKMYIEMLEALPDVLGRYSDLAYLRTISQEAQHPYQVFGLRPGELLAQSSTDRAAAPG